MVKNTLSAGEIARANRLSDLAWDDDGEALVWLEGRSSLSTLVSWSRKGHYMRDLTRDWSLRARVGYGGGDFSIRRGVAYFVDGRQLFRQALDSFQPERILESEFPLAAPTPSPDGNWLAVIESTEGRDRLLLVRAAGGPPVELFADSHFCMQPVWSPSGDRLAWISWNHPSMPWQESRALVAEVELDSGPRLSDLAELSPGGSGSAAFQPSFSPDGQWISCVSDRAGWFNLELFRARDLRPVSRWEDAAEHAPPAWLQGMRSYSWMPDSRGLWLLRSSRGFSELFECTLEPSRRIRIRGQIEEFTCMVQPSAHPSGASLALIASSPDVPPCVVECSRSGAVSVLRRSIPEVVSQTGLGMPEPVTWQYGTGCCHALLWPPTGSNPRSEKAVIRVHGGPQSQALVEFDFDVHFYSSRGFWVLDVNYRGSSGYGRDYRQSLEGRWGKADVEDIASAADFLVQSRGIRPSQIVLSGGSAGGFTILLALARYPGRFRAAVCRYAVTDLFALTKGMPKFERYYLHSLIGPPDQCKAAYRERSPLQMADRITDPVALFQGEEDKVVPPSQSQCLERLLRGRGVPCLLQLFPGEGHGWRHSETIRRYYDLVDEFLEEHLS